MNDITYLKKDNRAVRKPEQADEKRVKPSRFSSAKRWFPNSLNEVKTTSNGNNLKKILFVQVLILIVGIASGAVFANNLEYEMQNELGEFLSEYLAAGVNGIDGIDIYSKKEMFKISFFKHMRIVFFMCIATFLPLGFIFNGGVVFLKGLSYGFTTAFFIVNFGVVGLKNNLGLYFFQNVFLVPAILIIAITKSSDKKFNEFRFSYYEIFILFFISCILVFTATVVETFFVKYFR